MNDIGSGSGPDDGDAGSWTTETLPLNVRKALLERELKKLGFRKASHAAYDSPAGQQQQQPQGGSSSHPAASSQKD
jgi:hypothetical protein